MFKLRKGITPVIAIVLLILITLGMIGIVWTQFQGILQFGGQASSQQQAINTQLTISSVYNDGGTMRVTWRNPNDRTLNTSKFQIGFSKTSSGSPVTASVFAANTQFNQIATPSNADCFDDGTSTLVKPQGQQDCNTGLQWPSSKPIDMYVKVSMKGADKTFSYHCTTDTTSAFSC
ncbi:MAG: hypothetical protein ABEJ69_01755 [Candidatus Nanohaloarchaea archaeon]